MHRRQVLLGTSALLAGVAGCSANERASPTGTETSTDSTSSTRQSPGSTTEPPQQTAEPEIRTLPQRAPSEEIDCSDEDIDPVEAADGESYPEQADGFELTASTETITIGDEITFSLRNVSDKEQTIGVIYKYNIQRREDGEWGPIYYTRYLDVIDDVVRIAPGGGYDWPFTFTREGLERNNGIDGARYYVCEPLTPGVYRFSYWGVDVTLSTRFTVEQS